MATLNDTPSFRLTVKACHYYDVVVDAPNYHAAVGLVREQWENGELDANVYGYAVLLDEDGDDSVAIAHW